MVTGFAVVVAVSSTPGSPAGLEALSKLSSKAFRAMVEDDGQVALLIETTAKEYAPLVNFIAERGGSVSFQYKYINAIAASVPASAMLAVANQPSVLRVHVDEIRTLEGQADLVSPESALIGPRLEELAGVSIPLEEDLDTATLRPQQVRQIGPQVYNLGLTNALGTADAWKRADFGAGTTVAIIDTGIFSDHFMLKDSVVGGIDLSPDVGTGFEGFDRLNNHWHGSHVAGIVLGHGALMVFPGSTLAQSIENHTDAELPVKGGGQGGFMKLVPLFGMAPLAKTYVIKVFPHTGAGVSESRIIAAIEHAIDVKDEFSIDAISMSLGGATLFDGRDLEDRTVDAAVDAGIAVVSAAGNDGPASMTVSSPGSAFKGVGVAAAAMPVNVRVLWDVLMDDLAAGGQLFTSDEPQIISFSSRGPTAGLSAAENPKPDVAAPGVFVLSAFPLIGNPNAVAFASGTSMATPHASGATLLLQAFAEIEGFAGAATPTDMKGALKASAQPLPLYDSRDFGAGLINASAALDALESATLGATETALSELTEPVELFDLAEGALSGTVTLAPGENVEVIVPASLETSNISLSIANVDLGEDAFDNETFLEAFGWEQPQVNSLELYIHGAKRGGSFFDYEVDSANVFGDATFWVNDTGTGAVGDFRLDVPFKPFGIFNARMIEPGFYKLVIENDWTSFDDISFSYVVDVETEALATPDDVVTGTVTEGTAFLDFTIVDYTIGEEVTQATFVLLWEQDYTWYPTYDLDLVLVHFAEDGSIDFVDAQAATLNSPEKSVLGDPPSGDWWLVVIGFSIPVEGESDFTIEVFLEE